MNEHCSMSTLCSDYIKQFNQIYAVIYLSKSYSLISFSVTNFIARLKQITVFQLKWRLW